jgi:hypothetical protein
MRKAGLAIALNLRKAHRQGCLEADLSERWQGRVQDVDHDRHELPEVGDDDPGVAPHRADQRHESGQVGGGLGGDGRALVLQQEPEHSSATADLRLGTRPFPGGARSPALEPSFVVWGDLGQGGTCSGIYIQALHTLLPTASRKQ